jgi:hypothetical protein
MYGAHILNLFHAYRNNEHCELQKKFSHKLKVVINPLGIIDNNRVLNYKFGALAVELLIVKLDLDSHQFIQFPLLT